MLWLVGGTLLALVAAGLLVMGLLIVVSSKSGEKATGGWTALAGVVVGVLWAVWSLTASYHGVEAGHVAVVYQFGAITGQIGEGPNWIAPWKTVKMENIQTQRHVFPKLEAFSKETQDVFVKATLNVRVSPETIQQLYRNVGPNWFEVLVESRVAQNFKDETVKYESIQIAPHREEIRKTVRDRLERELSPYSIEVVDLLLDNIDFRPEFKAAIEAKQIATQRALEEEQKVFIATHQASQLVEQAKGKGSAIFEEASGQAKANDKLSKSLSPELLQYALIQKLGGNIEVIILPAGQNFILDSDMLKGKTK